MSLVQLSRHDGIAVVTLQRGKVNALNPSGVAELRGCFEELSGDDSASAIILTGAGPFFSFGFDIPELMDFTKEEFTRFLESFTGLYREIFTTPKPVIAALNGHTIAGGCMLACACDYRVMVQGRARIALNEVTFGASVFAGSVEALTACVGQRNAERILLSGSMLSAEEASALGLVDRVAAPEEVQSLAHETAADLGSRDPVAFGSIKALLRDPIAQRMRDHEAASIRAFVDIWYSDGTRAKLAEIRIRE